MYTEILPSGSLMPVIECIWKAETSSIHAPLSTSRILPDGCVDLIFDLTEGSESAYWVGTMTRSLLVQRKKLSKLLGIRFNPGAARALLHVPLSQLTDQRVDIAEVTPELSGLFDRVLQDTSRAHNRLESYLQNHLIFDSKQRLVGAAFRLANEQHASLRVSDVCDSLGVSRQYLNRVFRDRVGVDFKTLHRILRIRHLAHEVSILSEHNWCDLAAKSGFYDQSHLIHEFKELVGVTPEEFVR